MNNVRLPLSATLLTTVTAATVTVAALLTGCGQEAQVTASATESVTGAVTTDTRSGQQTGSALSTTVANAPETTMEWAKYGKAQASEVRVINTQPAKNLVLVVGDGMGITTLTAARIFAGQQQGLDGEEFRLSFEAMPNSALIKTYNTDQQTPDSAGTMTALVTGQKTDAGVLSVGPLVQRGDCASAMNADNQAQLTTLLDLAESLGKDTGIVTTTRITHATPAAMYSHSVERDWESNDALPEDAVAAGCKDIARQLIEYAASNPGQDGVDIILGGGRRHFLPESDGGKRTDGRNLMQEWEAQGGQPVLTNARELARADLTQGRWLGLFASSHIPYVNQRNEQVPGLLDMTQAAWKRLNQNDRGFVLVIEAGRIDHGHHAGNAYLALREAEELHQTMSWVLEQANLDNTLVITTADHSHTLTLAGYPTRGNPILGLVRGNNKNGEPDDEPVLLDDGKPYTSISYRNGPGAVVYGDDGERPAMTEEQARGTRYLQQALVPLESETHGGEDVALYAAGPWAHLFGGTMEQNWVYHVMQHALTAGPTVASGFFDSSHMAGR